MPRQCISVIALKQLREKHPRWKGGKTVTSKGYVRLTAGPNRFRYEHRVLAESLWRETHGTSLPEGFEVHHLDFCRSHNCPANLLILGPGLHEAAHVSGWRRDALGRYTQDDEVPF